MINSQLYKQMQAYLEDRMPFYMNLLRQMVAINSFTANAEGVNALGELTAAVFAKLGFTAETVQSATPQYGRHLILTRSGRSGRRVGFVSHLDTVFPQEEERRNGFAWREEGDRIYGPGTADIKGGTVLMLMMLDGLRTYWPDVFDDITWVLLLDASEEADAEDFGRLCLDRLDHAETLACLIFEAGNKNGNEFQIVAARKGMAVCQVTVEGKAAHAGSAHENGANAIVQLADTILRLAAVTDYKRNVTVNVGFVAGGTVTNRVPHHAVAALEMRAFTPEAYEEALGQILALEGQSVVGSANGKYPCKVRVEVLRKTEPWPRNGSTDQLLAIWQEAARSLGFRVVPEERGGLSDGNHFWHTIATLDGLGPAGGNAHCSEQSDDGSKEQEYCLRNSFVPKALLNTAGLLQLIALRHGG